jgi:hypothetical protein
VLVDGGPSVEAIPPALKERVGLIGFNDTRQRNYRDVLQLIEDARTLACADAAQPAKRRPAKPPADRQRHSAVIHADRAVPAPVIHAEFALTER